MSTPLPAVNPDRERARDEDDRKRESEGRDKEQRLDARHRLSATADDRPCRRLARRHSRSSGHRRQRTRLGDSRLTLTAGSDEGQKIGLTEQADEPRRTTALEASRAVDARAVVTAWRRETLVDVLRTVATGKPGRARAPEIVHQLRANAAVGARSRQTLVDVVLAQCADEPGRALALEVIRLVDASAAVEARVDSAFVAVDLAAVTDETGRTDAMETAACVQA